MDSERISKISKLRGSIDNTHLEIVGKINQIKILNQQKLELVESVRDVLVRCRQTENRLHDKLIRIQNIEAHDKLEEYNVNLKDIHEEGSKIIGMVNGVETLEELSKLTQDTLEPFLLSVKRGCNRFVNTDVSVGKVSLNQLHPDMRIITTSNQSQSVRGYSGQPRSDRTNQNIAKVIQDYRSKYPGTLELPKNTIVRVEGYKEGWVYVSTSDGRRGYISRYFIQPIAN